RARDDEDVGLARRGPERERAPAVDVVAGGREAHHLDRATGQTRQERPEAVGPEQVEDVVGLRRDDLEETRPAGGVAAAHAGGLELGEVGGVGRLSALVGLRVGRWPELLADDAVL